MVNKAIRLRFFLDDGMGVAAKNIFYDPLLAGDRLCCFLPFLWVLEKYAWIILVGSKQRCLSHILYGHHIFCMSGRRRKHSLNGEVKCTHIKSFRHAKNVSGPAVGVLFLEESEYDMEHDNVFFYPRKK